MFKKIPRQVWLINLYGYFVVSAAIIGATLLMLNSNNFVVVDAMILAAVVAGLGYIWWRFHPRPDRGMPPNADAFLREISHFGKWTLLAFESEYCPMCMTIGRRVTQLKRTDGLQVYRLSVNSDPGHTLFRRFDGRVTPTYVLLDPLGKMTQEWPIALPVERVLYVIRQQAAS